ncbi:LysR family transcriptional regulator [Leifsonia sp. LS1]|uniref:LysR family transcriptional regulator n=1 Tax=Leifsonia sp. LS1 TaxID=2828483 RepID=UPI001CFD8EF0|nr:LysR family transcriptional regulator [Leifsonia sp. LS1]
MPGTRATQQVAQALAVAVVIVRSPLTHAEARSLLHQVGSPRQASNVLKTLHTSTDGPRVLQRISQLAEWLDDTTVPIDYARRRSLDYATLLSPDQWRILCRRAGVRSGGTPRWQVAHASVHTLLTAGAPLAKSTTNPNERASTAASIARFHSSAPPILLDLLHGHAQQYLKDAGISEPTVWHPPLPPEFIDGASSAPLSASTASADNSNVWAPTRATARDILPTVVADYLSGKPLRQIAAETGVSKQTLSRLLLDGGHALRRPGRPPAQIEPEWLRTRYLEDKRTLNELAAETKSSPSAISNALKAAGIPARPPGPASRRSALRPDDTVPSNKLLRRALTGIGAPQRAARFLVVARHRTLADAAREIGCAPSTLSTQLTRLAADTGATLLTHAERGRALELTRQGQALHRALKRYYTDNPA